MIHEAMTLEYSGRSLALIELGGYLKQIVWFLLAVNLVPDKFFINPLLSVIIYLTKILSIILAISLIEVGVAKMRLFRAVDFLVFAFLLAAVSFVAAIVGL
jgi:formate hydrogenlyase subunit 4